MAKNAGLKGSILVSTGQIKAEELYKNTDCVVNNLREVLIK